ncbi:hypothetical protein H5410_037899 [Solanum commersonii]|uniref:Uncharacterized protein n=1 Tax=Solanum commersonii TaxID=4109 RepID=A0A9J5Y7I1_SOLCO|nr:hypothetical protein H5410_037891 [Solanum commersonii]KAG5596667.1 hypothetical protein H5410_037899 [Solanum commersonii]
MSGRKGRTSFSLYSQAEEKSKKWRSEKNEDIKEKPLIKELSKILESILFGSDPKSSSRRIHSTLPFEAAKCKTVRPLLSDSLASIPFFSNWLNKRSSPLFAAKHKLRGMPITP